MINKVMLCLIGFLVSFSAGAQSPNKADSLLTVLKQAKTPLQQLKIYNLLGETYQSLDSAKTALYTSKAIALAEKINYLPGKAEALNYLAWSLIRKRHFKLATEYLAEALKISEKSNFPKGKADSWNNLGWIQIKKANYDRALEFFEKELTIRKALKDSDGAITCYNAIGVVNYYKENYDQALINYHKSVKISKQINNLKKIAAGYYNIGMIHQARDEYLSALKYYKNSLKIKEHLRDSVSIRKNLGDIGSIYQKQGDYSIALDYYHKALTISERLRNQKSISVNCFNIAIIFGLQRNFTKAFEYHLRALKIRKQINYKFGVVKSLNAIGNLKNLQGKKQEAINYFQESFKIANATKSNFYSANTLKYLADAYKAIGKYKLAEEKYLKGIELGQKAKMRETVAFMKRSLGEIYIHQKKFSLAETYLQQAQKLAQDIKSNIIKKNVAENLAVLYENTGKYKQAYEQQVIFKQLSDSLISKANTRKITRLEVEHEFQKEKDSLKQENVIQAANLEKEKLINQSQRNAIFLTLALLLAIVVFTGIIYRSRLMQKRLNAQLTVQKLDLQNKHEELATLNEELLQNQEEIEAQRDALTLKNDKLSLYRKRVEQSFRSAQLIQNAFLPSPEYLQAVFVDSFVLYKPKDVVSGDFYWMNKINKKQVLVVADCTGHGVPGAFMTLIGTKLLDNIVKIERVSHPVDILKRLNREIKLALHQDEDNEEPYSKGGMDAAVVVFTPPQNREDQTTEVQINFSGAKSSLLYYNLQTKVLQEQRGSRKSIGGLHLKERKFETHIISLPIGSTLYLGSDGLADQNNQKSQKFGAENLKRLLQTHAHYSMAQQKQLLENALNTHMKNTEQRDDILWMGLKL